MTGASGTDAPDEPTEVPELRGAQRDIREAFFAHDAGLFVLDCNPGAGKSTVADQIAAEALVRAHRDGEHAPEQRLCVTSFARDDAAAIEPGVEAALHAIAERDDPPVELTHAEADDLGRRLRRSEGLGTIDSVLRSVFADVATEVGFDGMPTVGNDALLASLREDCLDALRDDPEHAARVERLDEAYPGGEYTAGLDDLLPAALRAVRERCRSVAAFGDHLRGVVAQAYPDGPPAASADVVRDIEGFVDGATADATAETFDADDWAAFIAADRDCYDSWTAAVDDFCELLDAYAGRYDALSRERGVAAHLDAAHWVATYFGDDTEASDYRERVRERHAARLRTLVVDEAQDVSIVQHEALAPFVDDDCRALLVGDVKQCIYTWRNAQPSLFERAFDEGAYFGVDWDTHETARAARTYRSRPDVAAAVDTVFADTFADPARGDAGTLAVDYPNLDPSRAAVTGPNVHVAAYRSNARPGSADWAADEARVLASYLAGALDGGTLDTDTTDEGFPSVTVLFPRRTHMDVFAAELEGKGLSVANASQFLFDHPLVRVAVAVVRWLVDPFDPERTRALLDRETFPDDLTDAVADHGWSVEATADALGALDAESRECADGAWTVLSGLAALATRHARHVSVSGALVVEDVVAHLSLAADPLGLTGGDGNDDGGDGDGTAERRVAALDALCDHVAEWEGDDTYTLAELADVLGRYAETPADGPDRPVADPDAHDVVFRTIHQMKGDEGEVVVLADLGASLDFYGPHTDVFVARGSYLALAPPAGIAGRDTPSLDGFDFGVYADPEREVDDAHGQGHTPRRDAGLRWASERWVDGPDGDARLAGPPPLRAAAGDHRAERWRLLFVAMTRARDHLVVPLPRNRDPARRRPREYWMDTLLDAFEFERAPDPGSGTDTYAVEAPALDGDRRTFTVGVNDVDLVERVQSGRDPPTPAAATGAADQTTGWTPRYVNASTLYPLATAADEHVLAHLQGKALHTERESPDESLPLGFDTLGPDTVGRVAHRVLTGAVARDVPTAALRDCTGPVASVLDEALREEAEDVRREERRQLRAFVAETVCPQFAATDTWARLQASPEVYVEEPLDAVLRVDAGSNSSPRAAARSARVDAGSGASPRIETYNVADVVSVDADGGWHVDDLKVALAASDRETTRRYDLQAATYAWLLERQLAGESVTAGVTRLGVDPEERAATAPVVSVDEWFAQLTGLSPDRT